MSTEYVVHLSNEILFKLYLSQYPEWIWNSYVNWNNISTEKQVPDDFNTCRITMKQNKQKIWEKNGEHQKLETMLSVGDEMDREIAALSSTYKPTPALDSLG